MDINFQLSLTEEDTWLMKATRGDLEGFNQLVLKYQDLLYHYAYTILGDPALSEDATQESFIKAFRKIGLFRGGSFRAWLLKIVRNTAYDMLRQRKNWIFQPSFLEDSCSEAGEDQSWIDPSPSVQAIVEQNQLADRLNQLLAELPDKYQRVIILVDIYELDYHEAALALGIPVGTVKSRLARARLQMKGKLKIDASFQRITESYEGKPQLRVNAFG